MITSIHTIQDISRFCRKNDIWNLITDFSGYQNIVSQIDAIHIHESVGDILRTEWFITLDGAPFSWIEMDNINQNKFTIRSKAISGDFDVWQGTWRIEDTGRDKIRLCYALDYSLGIPVIEENLSTILQDKLQMYTDTLVLGISKHSTTFLNDERRF